MYTKIKQKFGEVNIGHSISHKIHGRIPHFPTSWWMNQKSGRQESFVFSVMFMIYLSCHHSKPVQENNTKINSLLQAHTIVSTSFVCVATSVTLRSFHLYMIYIIQRIDY